MGLTTAIGWTASRVLLWQQGPSSGCLFPSVCRWFLGEIRSGLGPRSTLLPPGRQQANRTPATGPHLGLRYTVKDLPEAAECVVITTDAGAGAAYTCTIGISDRASVDGLPPRASDSAPATRSGQSGQAIIGHRPMDSVPARVPGGPVDVSTTITLFSTAKVTV